MSQLDTRDPVLRHILAMSDIQWYAGIHGRRGPKHRRSGALRSFLRFLRDL